MSKNINIKSSGKSAWLKKTEDSSKVRDAKFITTSSEPVELMGSPDMTENIIYDQELGYSPGYPFTRGIHSNM
jgi:hypothetical protein